MSAYPALTTPPAIVRPASPDQAERLQSFDMDAFLRAEVDVQTGNRWNRTGAAGEVGGLQIRALTWHCYTSMPFAWARRPRYAFLVGAMHAQTIRNALRYRGLACGPKEVALVWRCGLSGFLEGKVSAKARDEAQRVANLYSVLARP